MTFINRNKFIHKRRWHKWWEVKNSVLEIPKQGTVDKMPTVYTYDHAVIISHRRFSKYGRAMTVGWRYLCRVNGKERYRIVRKWLRNT